MADPGPGSGSDPSTLIERTLEAYGVSPGSRLPLGRAAELRWRARIALELLKVLGNDYDLVPRGEHERLRSAAARALERVEVAADPTGAADEAATILAQVISLDGTVVHEERVSLRRPGPHGLSAEELQRQLGVCPHCGKNETVVNVESDLFVCVTPLNLVSAKNRRGHVAGCGAQWRGARLGVPQ